MEKIVLVISDGVALANRLQKLAADCGFRSHLAENAEKGRQLFAIHEYAVVIGEDIGLLQWIRKRTVEAPIPFLFRGRGQQQVVEGPSFFGNSGPPNLLVAFSSNDSQALYAWR